MPSHQKLFYTVYKINRVSYLAICTTTLHVLKEGAIADLKLSPVASIDLLKTIWFCYNTHFLYTPAWVYSWLDFSWLKAKCIDWKSCYSVSTRHWREMWRGSGKMPSEQIIKRICLHKLWRVSFFSGSNICENGVFASYSKVCNVPVWFRTVGEEGVFTLQRRGVSRTIIWGMGGEFT